MMPRILSFAFWICAVAAYMIALPVCLVMVPPGEGKIWDWIILAMLLWAGLLSWIPTIIHLRGRRKAGSWSRRGWLAFHLLTPPFLLMLSMTVGAVFYVFYFLWTESYEFTYVFVLPVAFILWELCYLIFVGLATIPYVLLGLLWKPLWTVPQRKYQIKS